MRKSWLTPEEKLWLEHRKPKYLEARRNHAVGRFLAVTICNWVEEFHPHRDIFPDKPVSGFSLTEEESDAWAEYLEMNKQVRVFLIRGRKES